MRDVVALAVLEVLDALAVVVTRVVCVAFGTSVVVGAAADADVEV